jgi:hypothetical protein
MAQPTRRSPPKPPPSRPIKSFARPAPNPPPISRPAPSNEVAAHAVRVAKRAASTRAK